MINSVRDLPDFALVMHSQDWHCADHVSFASQHAGKEVYDVITLSYDGQGKRVFLIFLIKVALLCARLLSGQAVSIGYETPSIGENVYY